MTEPARGAILSESMRGRPATCLRPLVAFYQGYRQAGVVPRHHRGLPSPYITLIVTLDDPLVIARHPDPRQPEGRYDALVGGLHTTPALITHDGRQSGIHVSVHPLAARALFGCPGGELGGLDFSADAVLGRQAERLRERVLGARTWPERFAALDQGLIELAERRRMPSPAQGVVYAWELMVANGGRMTVEDLARQSGWGDRHLRTLLRAETGLGPKAALRVIRFDRARRRLAAEVGAGRGCDLAGLAAACGYYDQAHLTREFDALAGCPPRRWASEELRNVQSSVDEILPG